MLDSKTILKLFDALNDELRDLGVCGEIGICGGAVMCLVFNARESTKDVDAVFRPTREIRRASKAVAAKLAVPEDWLNDAAKGFFLSQSPARPVLDLLQPPRLGASSRLHARYEVRIRPLCDPRMCMWGERDEKRRPNGHVLLHMFSHHAQARVRYPRYGASPTLLAMAAGKRFAPHSPHDDRGALCRERLGLSVSG